MTIAKLKSQKGLLFSLCLLTGFAYSAEPFAECPSKAFLFQGSNVQIYSVNLATGNYGLLEDFVGLNGNINAVGFSFDDRFLYGFNTSSLNIVRIDKELQAETLPVAGLPTNTSFFVGDVSNSIYWLYRKGVGLYRININPAEPNYLTAISVNGADVSLNLTDFAFHPETGELYAVDNGTGHLHRINTATGQNEDLGYTGVKGTFGAGYFDVNGYYYIGRNNDGHIYRIDITDAAQPNPVAEFFAQGPASSQNDGARCAFAPIEVVDTDFGDAPASYQTSLADNGPRHQITQWLRLGSELTDGEMDGLAYPLSDDGLLYDDEDGVYFHSSFDVGLDAHISVTIVGSGVLNAWFDWDQNGQFDETEQTLVDLELANGVHDLPIRVPDTAFAGDTWSRFRITSQPGTRAYGGAADGEVEDYSLTVNATDLSYRYYPSKGGWVTLAFEDTWPEMGDYDLNDVVLHYRLVEVFDNNRVHRIDVQGEILALGADYHSGFAVHLPTLSSSIVDGLKIHLAIGKNRKFKNLLRSQQDLVIDISKDLQSDNGSPCPFYRTTLACDLSVMTEFDVSIPFNTVVDVSDLPSFPYNPFIFGTENSWRGSHLTGVDAQTVEIHLPNFPPTLVGASQLFGRSADDSSSELNRYYRTENNLPWALLIPSDWRHPFERVDILSAYPNLKVWAESDGAESSDWYLINNADIKNLF